MSLLTFRRIAAAAFLFLCLPLAARADFSFIHASDSHFGASATAGNGKANAERFAEISRLEPRPAFVALTGDVCEIATDAEYDAFRRVRDASLQVPLYVAPGNHDVRWNPRGKEGYTKGTGQPLYQSWDRENVHFVLLDSTVLLQHWGHFDQAQLDWLARDLQKAGTQKPVIIGFHHWVGRESVQVDNEDALLRVLSPYNVRLFLIGHGHSDITWSINGVPAIMVKGLYQGSYNLVKVSGERLEVYRRSEKNPTPTELVLSEPLARPVVPARTASVRVENGALTASLRRGDFPRASKATFRLDAGAEQPLPPTTGEGWGGSFPVGTATPGTHKAVLTVTTPDNARAYQTTVLVTLAAPKAFAPLWTVNVGGAVQGKLATFDGLVYVPSMGGALVALDARTGKEKWRVPTGGAIFSAPLVSGGTVYFGSADHFVYAADARTGKQLWRVETGGAVFGGASLAGGVVCIASTDTKIYGLDARTGKTLWTAQGEGMYQSQTATDGTRFFVGGWDNYFRCLDARSGVSVWKNKFGRAFYYAPAIGSPTVADGKAFVTSNDGVLHAMDAQTGKILWEVPGPSLGYSGPLYENGRIYNASLTGTGRVFAFDASTGKTIWDTPTGSVIYDSSCAMAGGKVFVGCVDGTFSALNAEDGKLVWQYRLAPGHLLASPAVDKERVYIGSLSGDVVASRLVLAHEHSYRNT